MIRHISLLACAALLATASLAHAASAQHLDAACFSARAAPQDNVVALSPQHDAIVIRNISYAVDVRFLPRIQYAVLMIEPNQTAWPGSRLVAADRFHLRL